MSEQETTAPEEQVAGGEDEIFVGEVVDEGVAAVPAEVEGDLDPHDLGLELPEDPEEAKTMLLRELVTTRSEADDFLHDLRRVAAEFDNYRKRTQREQAQHVERASQRVVESLFPVLDSFDAAFTHDAQTPTEEKLLAGMRSTYHQLLDVLTKEGLELIPALGEEFDPEVHEAVALATEGEGRLVVTQELRRGYRLKGRVVRPALVAVEHA